jgi:hypothetical protein
MPQARFWIAMARLKSDRSQPNSSAMGIWNRPKLDRMAMLRRRMREPPMRTGVRKEALAFHAGS